MCSEAVVAYAPLDKRLLKLVWLGLGYFELTYYCDTAIQPRDKPGNDFLTARDYPVVGQASMRIHEVLCLL